MTAASRPARWPGTAIRLPTLCQPFHTALWFGGWVVYNVMHDHPFDPYPFGLLMLVVSLEAIFLSAAVLMTQNTIAVAIDREMTDATDRSSAPAPQTPSPHRS